MQMESSAPAKKWRGQTLHDRADERREQLLDTAYDLVAAEGVGALTMRAVTRAANLSPRYFYESFPDRDALLFAVFDRTVEQLQQRVAAAMADSEGMEAKCRAAFSAAAHAFDEDPRAARLLLREALADNMLREHALAALPHFVFATATHFLPEPADQHGVDALRLQLDMSALSGAVVTLFLDWTEDRLAIPREELVDYCTELVVGILIRHAG
ncbi:TetR/AcrR family transcriptional regulator [Hoyosella sp. YIM 151337]|uniref:TetR/AcrR family transcriptional regulator n=1 Tax=Hoyosella sp. YIM 151337 TaxID=2992742 RepID=UPI002235B033|nr:TetR/AcrR family transcriptional regulator [Hoyosella sp. YIM 151337]MCW4354879.1 TetR/AcrR family transcriptional regulator [Hoyosella sp. YIM 151337]